MNELKKVYGHFDLLKKNKDEGLTKVTYSSLDKYNKSPYLQSRSHIMKKLFSTQIRRNPSVGR